MTCEDVSSSTFLQFGEDREQTAQNLFALANALQKRPAADGYETAAAPRRKSTSYSIW
jgi:hypothetical protein